MKWYLMRHGEIQSNVDNKYAGWNDEGLTHNGKKQVKRIAEELVKLEIDTIFCSPLNRAIETAEILSNYLEVKYFTEKNFKELKLGKWEGKYEATISKIYPAEWETWNIRPNELAVEGRETLRALLARVLIGIKCVRNQFEFNSPLIISHVSVIRVLILYTRQMDMNLYKTISVPNAKIFEVSGL